MNRNRIARRTIAAASAAMLMASAPIGVMASSASSAASAVAEAAQLPDELNKACENTFVADDVINSLKDLGSVFTDRQFGFDFNLSGGSSSAESSEASEPAVSASVSYAQDADAKNQSLTGTVSMSGVNIDFQEYLDEKHIVLSCPTFLEKALSYDYTNDNPTGGLASYKDTLAQVNGAIRAVRDAVTSGSFTISNEYRKAVTDALNGSNLWTDGGTKDVTVDGSAVSCTGYTMTLTGEQLSAVYKAAMDTPLSDGGMSMRELLSMFGSFAGAAVNSEASDITSQLEEAESQLGSVSAVYTYYIDDKYVREIDVTMSQADSDSSTESVESGADSTTMSILLTGKDVPWHEMTMSNGESTVLALSTAVDGSKTTYSFATEDGSAVTLSYDTASGAFALGDGSSTVLEGTFAKSDDGYKLNTAVEGYAIDLTFKKGAKVTPFDGETMELTTASEEELSSLMETLSSLFGSGSGETDSSPEGMESEAPAA